MAHFRIFFFLRPCLSITNRLKVGEILQNACEREFPQNFFALSKMNHARDGPNDTKYKAALLLFGKRRPAIHGFFSLHETLSISGNVCTANRERECEENFCSSSSQCLKNCLKSRKSPLFISCNPADLGPLAPRRWRLEKQTDLSVARDDQFFPFLHFLSNSLSSKPAKMLHWTRVSL